MLNEWKAIHLGDTAARWKETTAKDFPCREDYRALWHSVFLWPLSAQNYTNRDGVIKSLGTFGFNDWMVGAGVELDAGGKVQRKLAVIQQPFVGMDRVMTTVTVDESTARISPCLNEFLGTPGYFV